MSTLLSEVEAYARGIAATRFPPTLCFHDVAHFEQVAGQAEQLARAAGLSSDDSLALAIAAWSHDLGYAEGYEGHEERSAVLITAFLQERSAPPALVQRVRALVLATREGAVPADPLEELIKDADMGHIGSVGYPERMALLRKERERITGAPIKKKAWAVENIAFLEKSRFHSAAARTLWEAQRLLNINALKTMSDEKKTTDEGTVRSPEQDAEKHQRKAEKKAQKERKEKVRETERGVETLFRVTLNNHTRLSQIADNKANIMLTVNALMISLLISGPMTRVDKHPEYIPALTLVLVTCVCPSSRPRWPRGPRSPVGAARPSRSRTARRTCSSSATSTTCRWTSTRRASRK